MTEQEVNRDNEKAESLNDLEITAEQAEEAKAGTGAHSSGMGAGKAVFQDLH